jgi:tRNA(adenine34) deaminase
VEPYHPVVIINLNDVSESDGVAELHVHEKMMELALEQAEEAKERGEVPIGAIVVREINSINECQRSFEILSEGRNEIEFLQDASAHAEMQALRSAASNIHNWRLLNSTLYSTLEPCPMCLSAAQAFRVSEIVYGAPDLRLGAIETQMNLLDLVKHPFHDTIKVTGGIKKEDCSNILVDFFRERRKKGTKKFRK